jgi:hypothetical protein
MEIYFVDGVVGIDQSRSDYLVTETVLYYLLEVFLEGKQTLDHRSLEKIISEQTLDLLFWIAVGSLPVAKGLPKA